MLISANKIFTSVIPIRSAKTWLVRCEVAHVFSMLIVGDCCDFQQHVGNCSGYKQYPDTWTTPSHCCCDILSYRHFSSRCHIFSSTSWCNRDPSLHEYGSVSHLLIHKFHQHSLPTSHQSDTSSPIRKYYLAVKSFFITAVAKEANLLN